MAAKSKPQKDSREFVRITTSLPDDPKLAEIDSPNAGLAGWLYVTAICWSRAQKTDGHVTARTVERKAGVAARWSRELIRVGLWHAPGHDCPSCPQPERGKVIIHDYLDHQQSKAETEAAKEAARLAAEARWGANKPAKPDAKRNADRIANRNAGSSAGGNAGSTAVRNAEVEVEEEPKSTTYFLDSGSDPSSSDLGKRAKSTSDDDGSIDGPSDHDFYIWTPDTTPGYVQLATERATFRARNRGSWAQLRNPRAAWLAWLQTAEKRSRPTPTPGTSTCPRHPGQPTGSKACPLCAAEAAAPPSDLRALRDEQREAS